MSDVQEIIDHKAKEQPSSMEIIEQLLNQVANSKNIIPPGADVFKKLNQQTTNVVRMSLLNWQRGYEAAIDVDRPDREELMELYEQIEIDTHISALIETITNGMLSNGFLICDEAGEIDVDETEIFQKPWFSQFLIIALEAAFWGFSGIQFTGVTNGHYSGSKVIPRKHIIPEKFGVRYQIQDLTKVDIRFDDRRLEPWTAFIFPKLPADQYQLGKFNKLAKYFILKREVTQFWAIFNELFGIPYRLMKTDINDSNRKQNAITAMESMVAAAYGIVDTEDEIEFQNGAQGTNVDTFERFLDQANREMSKCLVGSTMVLEDGSSRSQSEVHERNTQAFVVSYARILAEQVNDILIPKMQRLGLQIKKGHRFKWDDTEIMSKTEIVEMISKLNSAGYQVPVEYVVEQTGIPVEERIPQIPVDLQDEEDQDEDPDNPDPEDVQNKTLYRKILAQYGGNHKATRGFFSRMFNRKKSK